MSENMMTCADCDEMFLDHFEGTLEPHAREKFDSHVASCARCQGLRRDVDAIRDEAAKLPELVPSRDLWNGIEARIQPDVVSIASRPSRRLSGKWLVAAAAALIVATSGVTYLATMRSFAASSGSGKSKAVVAAPQVAMAKPETPVAAPPSAATIQSGISTESAKPTSVAAGHKSAESPVRSTSGTSLASATSRPAAVPTASEIAFAGEINQLQTVLGERRSQLDPETVKVVEDNLELIDTAVRHARSALAKDPASGFLMRQLDGVLQKKVELLRTAALLPAST
jgi:hypothetical protein